ncbi:MAG: methionyl-tRNA formyltransferase [Candidatus Omnitrophica bacterium]|nr:methionyl-tRNA formyltransferase [Candidatus Omnitrophota bacterium]MCM8802933.1 methionyl-tRNA formyltransferase [Candidatus Omnitrophota bacterium]
MKIIFFGSDNFGIPSVEILKRNFELVAVVTAPDKPKGRGLKISPNPVKEWAIANGINVYQPEKFEESFIDKIKKISPDLIVLISYGKILPSSILNIPKITSINVHPSLLPKYRGPAPIEWALINGETKTGITLIKMDENIDTGQIIIQKEVEISPFDNAFTLKNRLSILAAEVLYKGIEIIKQGGKTYLQKGESSYARKLKKEDGLIKWEEPAEKIHNLVRGVIIWPTAYTYLPTNSVKKIIKIYKTEIGNKEGKFGEKGEIIKIEKDYIEVACGEGTLKIKELQLEGKKRMTVSQFLCGYRNLLNSFG